MYKVLVSDKAITKIKKYISKYRLYHQELYLDSGIWSESIIIQKYLEEAESRYTEIRNFLESKISQSIPTYRNNQAILRWRTKILLVSFRQEDDTKVITDIDIR